VAYWRLGESSGSVAYDYYGGHNGAYFLSALGQPGFSVLDPDTAVAFNGANSHVGNINGTALPAELTSRATAISPSKRGSTRLPA